MELEYEMGQPISFQFRMRHYSYAVTHVGSQRISILRGYETVQTPRQIFKSHRIHMKEPIEAEGRAILKVQTHRSQQHYSQVLSPAVTNFTILKEIALLTF